MWRTAKWCTAIVCAVLLLLLLYDRAVLILWGGRTDLTVEFVVTDGRTGQPIAQAAINLVIDETKTHALHTDSGGKATITIPCMTAGRQSGLGLTNSSSVIFSNWQISITASGHQSLTDRLIRYADYKDTSQENGPHAHRASISIPLDPE
ncbi:hypothetical protein [Limnoglobus roseus]|uniref:Carboxypeptidase regulatory-like domain-containing protein n=1 Tax=Limnoglobus roseus TaxID=2598579 RepID=A0A5C1A9M1_9BACT|nr:hypothetical protein [Limnoglobus roseus]QEL13814.1 hypothetical protein PX52LOC_00672 [Limnoglobus roseus]